MPVAAADLILYGSANRPNDDTSTVGGAIATTDRPVFTQFTAAAAPAIVSDGADTRNCTIVGRNAAGDIISEVNALNGAVEVVFSASFERILTITLASSDGSRTVSIKQGSGGTTRATIGPNETTRSALFRRSASSSSQEVRYEKVFWKNTHGTLSLTTANVRLTADPESEIEIGLEASKDGTQSATNRATAPSPSVTFVDDATDVAVPTGSLGAGEAIGTWIKQTRAADAGPINSTFTIQLSGQTT